MPRGTKVRTFNWFPWQYLVGGVSGATLIGPGTGTPPSLSPAFTSSAIAGLSMANTDVMGLLLAVPHVSLVDTIDLELYVGHVLGSSPGDSFTCDTKFIVQTGAEGNGPMTIAAMDRDVTTDFAQFTQVTDSVSMLRMTGCQITPATMAAAAASDSIALADVAYLGIKFTWTLATYTADTEVMVFGVGAWWTEKQYRRS